LPRVALVTICDKCRYLLNISVSRVLKSPEITIPQSGYLRINASHEDMVQTHVFFMKGIIMTLMNTWL